jgi:quercetin dioxygenase-like cupin family protein
MTQQHPHRAPINLIDIASAALGKKAVELAAFDGVAVKFIQAHGENRWHTHDFDEGFYLISGDFVLQIEASQIQLSPGDFFVVGRGLKHRGVSENGAALLRLESKQGITTIVES